MKKGKGWSIGSSKVRPGGLVRVSLAVAAMVFMLSGCGLADVGSRLVDSLFALVPEEGIRAVEIEGEDQVRLPGESAERDGEGDGGEAKGYSFDRRLSFLYAYEKLNEEERSWYRAINDTLAVMGEETRLPREGIKAGLDESSLEKIFQCVLDDHPEYFYVEGYNYVRVTQGDAISRIEFSGTYTMSMEKAIEREGEIRQAAREILAGAEGLEDEYLRVKYLYETIILRTEYDLEAPDNQNIYSVLIGGRSVCQGYAKALQYLLGELGMEATLVGGMVEGGELHAWNLVRVDGQYYYVDATWGDTSYGDLSYEEASHEGGRGQGMNYEYLCVTTGALEKTHIIQSRVEMPLCTSMEANYYVREGMYAEVFDKEWLQTLFDRAAAEGRGRVWIKCASEDVYEEMVDWLIRRQRVFDYLPGHGDSLSYGQSDVGLLLTFWLGNS